MLQKSSTEPSVERIWVTINDRINQDTYVWTLDNAPYGNVYIKSGNKFEFKSNHIIDIFDSKNLSDTQKSAKNKLEEAIKKASEK